MLNCNEILLPYLIVALSAITKHLKNTLASPCHRHLRKLYCSESAFHYSS